MMVYREVNGLPIVNWQYVYLVYDHWTPDGRLDWVTTGESFSVTLLEIRSLGH